MESEYLECIKEDESLYAAVETSLPKLQQLSSAQVEKLIFYLKSLHNYYPKSENHVVFHSEFAEKLEGLKNSGEQIALMRRANASILKAAAVCVSAGVFLSVAIVAFVGGKAAIGTGFSIAMVACVILAESKLLRKAIFLSKEQDRRYFLSSIRAAKACNELDWAGIFSYNRPSKNGALSEADEARLGDEVGVLTSQLRSALYNDEYFQYSPAVLKATEASRAQ